MFLPIQGIVSGVAAGGTTDFVFTLETTGADENFTIPCSPTHNYDCHVDWGDSSSDDITTYDDAAWTHTYATAGTHTVSISGTFGRIAMGLDTDGSAAKLRTIENLGEVGWDGSNYRSFYNCTGLTDVTVGNYTGTVTNFQDFFRLCTSLVNLDLTGLDTSSATSYNGMFYSCGSLVTIDCTALADGAPTSTLNMFRSCSSATSINADKIKMASVTTATSMFTNANLWSNDQYDDALVAWSAETLQNTVILHAGDAKYTETAARLVLTGTYSWSITDGGAL